MADPLTNRFITAAAAREFILSGAAVFTIVSQKTHDRYTYKVQSGDRVHFVKLRTGPDENAHWTYLGIIKNDVFSLTRKSSMHDLSTPYQAFQYMWRWLTEADAIPQNLEVWHVGKCCVCGRPLTVPSSIEKGIGPECEEIREAKKMGYKIK